jgi:hypothetical protein
MAYTDAPDAQAADHQLMRVHAGEIPRLLINQPPRSLKSISVSVAYVAWLLQQQSNRSGCVEHDPRLGFSLYSLDHCHSVFPAVNHDRRGSCRQKKLVGLVSIGDMVKHQLAECQYEHKAMREYITTG